MWTVCSACPITARSGGSAAVIHGPQTPGFVSVRGTVTDKAGNTATVTIIRAYQTR